MVPNPMSVLFAEKMTEKAEARAVKSGDHFRTTYQVQPGRKYDKVVTAFGGGGYSAHAFVDRETGALYKAEAWAKPAKGIRFFIRTPEEVGYVVSIADPYGGYLYAR